MDEFLILFIFLTIIAILAWIGRYRLSSWLFIIFLIAASVVFMQQITSQINIQL